MDTRVRSRVSLILMVDRVALGYVCGFPPPLSFHQFFLLIYRWINLYIFSNTVCCLISYAEYKLNNYKWAVNWKNKIFISWMIGSGSKCPDKINYRNLTYRDSLSVARMFSAPTLMHYSFHYMKCYILLMHSTNVLMKKVLNIFLYNDIANQFFFRRKDF